MINKMSSHVISNIFCDFSLERDRPTNWQKDRQTNRASYRDAVAHLKREKKGSKPYTFPHVRIGVTMRIDLCLLCCVMYEGSRI